MRIKHILYITFLFTAQFGFAQEFNNDQQYDQAMANAKQAFEAQQYSQAVMFYREAMKIKPDALLPKYKVEDIRTIYIEIEKDSIIPETAAEIPKKISKREKKKIEEEQAVLEKIAEEKATIKMNEDADKAVAEIVELDVAVVTIVEEEESLGTEEIESIESDRETAITDLKKKETTKLENDDIDNQSSLTLTEREIPKIEKEEKTIEPKQEKKVETPKPKPVMTKPVYTVSKPKELSPTEKQQWIKEENEKLAKQYPNKKTIEVIEKPGKKITRIIMNIDGKVSIYLIVKHSWGATYFFKDELGQDLKSINQQYFNLMTNLETYEKP